MRSPSRSARRAASSTAPSAGRFWTIVLCVVLADVFTKWMAVRELAPRHLPHRVVGDVVRFTLAFNPGAAFGLDLGPASRWIFAGLSAAIIVVLLRSTKALMQESALAVIGVPIVVGGAIGNLLDRVRLREGVVDFIDIGIGSVRFWTFNLADTAVTIGAACLVLALWQQERDNTPLVSH